LYIKKYNSFLHGLIRLKETKINEKTSLAVVSVYSIAVVGVLSPTTHHSLAVLAVVGVLSPTTIRDSQSESLHDSLLWPPTGRW